MTFDEKLKARAAREQSPIPEGFDSRMDALLDTLPPQVQPARKRRAPRLAVCIGIAAAMVVGAAAAAPAILKMAQGAVNYFQSGQESVYTPLQTEYERFNAAVGMRQTVDGVTLSIDNIAVDDSYMSIFFTVSSETPLEQVGMESEPESWRAGWTAPVFRAVVNGTELDTIGKSDNEAYFVDDCTLKGIHRLASKDILPDQFDLLLCADGTSRLTEGEVRFEMSIDKSTVDCLTVEPALDFTVDYTGTYEDGRAYSVHRTPRIERVSISPLSSTLILSEQLSSADVFPFDAFVLRDDKGQYLTSFVSGTATSGYDRSFDVIEFLGADMDTQSVTLIPFQWSFSVHSVAGPLDALPLTDECENGLTLERLEVGDDKAVATFSTRGALWDASTAGNFALTDKDGNALPFNKFAYFDSHVDRETGLIVATLYYPDAAAEDVAKIAGVQFSQPNNDMVLLEEQAVTIDLQ